MVKYCTKCNRSQSKGDYCLDCGQPLEKKTIEKKNYRPINTTRSADTLKTDIRSWLGRIGCLQEEIQIDAAGMFGNAQVMYILEGQTYSFKSVNQEKVKDNLAAIEQFLHARVLGIERGIETIEAAFAGYTALPDYSSLLHTMSTKELKQELKQLHPDTQGTGDVTQYQRVLEELRGRKEA